MKEIQVDNQSEVLRLNSILTTEIFAIGSELCFGRIYDTNSFWLADQLTKLGLRVQRITCLPDDLESIVSTLQDSLSRRPTFLFLTGGLGPTEDDLTIEALSQATGISTDVNRQSLEWLAEKENVPAEKLDKRLNKMAVTLLGAECLRNPVGWAPATHFRFNDTDVFALPGPPSEMKGFFEKFIFETVSKRTGRKSCSAKFVVTMYEEEVSTLISQVTAKEQDVYIKALVSEYRRESGLPLEILVFDKDEDECHRKMEKTANKLSQLVSGQGRTMKPIHHDNPA